MSVRIVCSLVLMAMLGAPMVVMAAETTLTGEPVDISCFLTGKSGEDHASCAKTCAGKGLPVGFSVTDGDSSELYLVLGSAKDDLVAHMGKQVTVTGEVSDKDGMKVIEVSKVME